MGMFLTMKKNSIMRSIMLIVLAALLLAGCSGKEPYTLKTVDGVHYIEVGSEYAPSEEDLQFNEEAGLKFSTMDEMVDAVLNKKLDESQLKKVYTFDRDANGKIRTVDFTNLVVPVVPANHTLSSEVRWLGGEYTFRMNSKSGARAYVFCRTPELFEYFISDKYESVYGREGHNNAIKKEKVEDRNATVVYVKTDRAELKHIIYSFQEGQTQYTVFEDYTLKYVDPSSYPYVISDVIPTVVKLYVRNGDYCIEFQIRDLTERPSMEYLKQFNVEKFVPKT